MSSEQNAVDEDEKLVIVARLRDPLEAQMAKSALEANGIAVFLQGENASSLYPGALATRVLVSQQDLTAARELLNSPALNEDDAV